MAGLVVQGHLGNERAVDPCGSMLGRLPVQGDINQFFIQYRRIGVKDREQRD